MDHDLLLPMMGPRNCKVPFHAVYADGIMVFCKGTLSSLEELSLLLDLYGE
ncbi:hypothetical protein Fmac_029877 [Flemingia macrophylla]|uniref:Uncharacterized protein n=1 Tax=Flemingia macrophylla TaxID=520843 RepID=A0ABD1LBJ6_9FABA